MVQEETLILISQQLNKYWSIVILIFGVFGASANTIIFYKLSLRPNSCCVYLCCAAVASLIELLFGVVNRLLNDGFQLDWTSRNKFWCRSSYAISFCSSKTALSCLIMSIIDRFWSTCQEIKWRQLNSNSVAKQICLFFIMFWMILIIPIVMKVNLVLVLPDVNLHQCSLNFDSRTLLLVYHLCLCALMPWLTMTFFGLFIVKNIRKRYRERSKKISHSRLSRMNQQLIIILLIQSVICVLSSIPYCLYLIYQMIPLQILRIDFSQAEKYLIQQIADLCFYLIYSLTFYGYFLGSKFFRRSFKDALAYYFLTQQQRRNSCEEIVIRHRIDAHHRKHAQSRLFTILIPHPIYPV